MAKPASRRRGRSGGNPIFTGVLIGLIVGTVLAVGVALWATGLNPFKPSKPATKPATPVVPAEPDPAPSFDFYEVLPSDRPSELPPAAAPSAPAPRYFLQAGAFRNAADADNLKAQLALLGVEAMIQTSEVEDKGIFHRVRVGPYATMDEIARTRALLTQNDIPTTVVKLVPSSQETP